MSNWRRRWMIRSFTPALAGLAVMVPVASAHPLQEGGSSGAAAPRSSDAIENVRAANAGVHVEAAGGDGNLGYGMPRALPVDYAAAEANDRLAEGVLPRAMPVDYARAGVGLAPEAGMPRAMPVDYNTYVASEPEQGSGIVWASVGFGALIAFAAVLALALARGLTRQTFRAATH